MSARLDELRAGLGSSDLTDLSDFVGEFGPILGRLYGARHLTQPSRLEIEATWLQTEASRLHTMVCARFEIERRARPLTEFSGPQAVVVSDLVGYTPRALALIPAGIQLSDTRVSKWVTELDDDILTQLTIACSETSPAAWANHLVAPTGDGAIVRFDRVTDALAYARAIHRRAERFNRVSNPVPPHQHRVGIAFGVVVLHLEGHTLARHGIPFIQANRMESAVAPGGIAIEAGAWAKLCEECAATETAAPTDFTRREDIPGKVGEPNYCGWVLGGLATDPKP